MFPLKASVLFYKKIYWWLILCPRCIETLLVIYLIKIFPLFLKVNGESLRQMSHKNAVSALRLASSPVNISILREEPEKIFTSAEGKELLRLFRKMHLKKESSWLTYRSTEWLCSTPYYTMHTLTDPVIEAIFFFSVEPSLVFEVKLVKPITDYMGLSVLARK